MPLWKGGTMNNLKFPLFITWSITSNCNLRCKHCFRSEYECNELEKDTIDKFINLFIEKKVNRIILTGGEPLTSKNLLYIAEKLCGKIKLGIATNGTLLNEEIITKLNEYKVKDLWNKSESIMSDKCINVKFLPAYGNLVFRISH